MPEGLLSEIKAYLKVTWDDEDAALTGIVKRGMARLTDIAGAPLDFSIDEMPKSLLFDYCRYATSNALEMFETNFSSELLSLHIKTQVSLESDVGL